MKRSSFIGSLWIPFVMGFAIALAFLVYFIVDVVGYQSRHGALLLAPVATETPTPVVEDEEPACPPSLYDVLWGNEEGMWSYAYPGECDALPALPNGDEWFKVGSATRPYESEDLFVSQKDGVAQFGNVFSLYWVSGPVTQTLVPTELYHFVCQRAEVTLKVRYHDPQWGDGSRIRDLHGAIVCKDMIVTEVKR